MSHLNKVVLLLISLLLFSCGVDYDNKDVEGGYLSFTIPSVSSIIEEQFTEKEDAGRAFVVSSSVRLSLYNDLDELIVMNEYESDDEVNIILNPGYYSVYLEVFNHSNSTVLPVVHGESELFEIVPGVVTTTHIMLTPVNPVTLEENISQGINVQEFSESDFGYLWSIKSEYWFSLTAVTNATLVESSISTDIIRSAVVIAYDSNGSYIDSSTASSDLLFESVPGEIYYIAVIPFFLYNNGDYIYPSNVSITWSQYDITDNDNSFETATAINTDGTVLRSTLYTDDSDFYSFSVTAGTSYYIISESTNTIYADIYNDSFEIINSYSLYTHGTRTISFDTDQTIYIELTDNRDGIKDYGFFVKEAINEDFTPSSEWQVIDIYKNVDQAYRVLVTPGSTYNVSWDELYNGSGIYTSDVYVDAFDNLGNLHLNSIDTAYSTPQSITIPDGVSELYIVVRGYKTGTIGLKIEEAL